MSARSTHRVPIFEGLEPRQVLAAGFVSLEEGVLAIQGTAKSDKISVNLAGELGDQLHVVVNKAHYQFALVDVAKIEIHAGRGNDKVSVAGNVLIDAWIDGNQGNDWLYGGGGNDVVLGGAGNDRAQGGAGDDVLVGDRGNDRLRGGLGNDEVEGGAGNDHLWGDDGDDILLGANGHDRLTGGAGLDELFGGVGHDALSGGDGNDLVHGEAGNDRIRGGLGDDELFGDAGHDQIYGEDGNDWIDGGDGKDKLLGNYGDDRLKGGAGNDHLDGGPGANLLDGDAGKNHFKNGTIVDLDQPPSPPITPILEAICSSEGGKWSESLYEERQTPNGLDLLLAISVSNAVPGETLPVIIDGRVVGTITINSEGQGFHRLSSIVDEAGESPWPANLLIEAGTEITLGPELSGAFVLV